MGRLDGKVALITGGAGGLGFEDAKHFVDEGAKVAIADMAEEIGRTKATELGDDAMFVSLNVTDEDSWENAFTAVEEHFGAVTVLVNNAGIGDKPSYIKDLNLKDWNMVLAVDLTGVLIGVKYGMRHMAASGGSIINISSAIGNVGLARAAAYSAAKAGVRELTKTAALEAAELEAPIRVNSVHPGWVDTGIVPEMMREIAIAKTPVKRMGQLSEIANLLVYLASDESGFATGSEFVIDGGFLAG